MRRTIAAACILVAAWVVPGPAAAQGTGPAASAVQKWWVTDKSLGCFDQQAREVLCGAGIEHVTKVFYGNASGGPGNPDALAVIKYVNDPTGNAEMVASAYFHEEGGAWRMVRRVDIGGDGIVDGAPVRFGAGKATVTVSFAKPTDSRCCSTGRKQVAVQLR